MFFNFFRFKRCFLLVLLILALNQTGQLYAVNSFQNDSRPNIIFILTDDQRWDALGYAGNEIIQTPEIIRILETENIVYVATSHSQEIHIQLKDGRRFKGTYDQSEAGPYSNHEQLFDIYNLARHIKNNRPEKEVKHWSMAIQ